MIASKKLFATVFILTLFIGGCSSSDIRTQKTPNGDPLVKVNCKNNDFYAYPILTNVPESHRGRWVSLDELFEAFYEQNKAEYDKAYADENQEGVEAFAKMLIDDLCKE